MKQLILQFEDTRVMNRLIKVSKLIKGVSIVDVTSTPKKSGLDAALEDVKEGKVYKAKNVFIEYTRQFKRSLKLCKRRGLPFGGLYGRFLWSTNRTNLPGIMRAYGSVM